MSPAIATIPTTNDTQVGARLKITMRTPSPTKSRKQSRSKVMLAIYPA